MSELTTERPSLGKDVDHAALGASSASAATKQFVERRRGAKAGAEAMPGDGGGAIVASASMVASSLLDASSLSLPALLNAV